VCADDVVGFCDVADVIAVGGSVAGFVGCVCICGGVV